MLFLALHDIMQVLAPRSRCSSSVEAAEEAGQVVDGDPDDCDVMSSID